ncbi:MAG: hypothetical protein KDD99_10580, partial [Bacteroidetes bacterium]|nr:hypothetical protein [Bacteroidota bacterium]
MKFYKLALYLIIFLFIQKVQGQPRSITRQYVFEEISNQRANVFLEDSYGFIWIGGNRLLRFDGYEVAPFPLLDADSNLISTGAVYSLQEDSKGRLWVGTENGLFQYSRKTNRSKKFLSKSPNNDMLKEGQILSILEDTKGRLWVGDREYLYLIDNPDVDSFKIIDNIHMEVRYQGRPGITAIVESSNGNLYVATSDGLWEISSDLSANRLLPQKWSSPSTRFQIVDATYSSEGVIWLATLDGLWSFDPLHKKFSKKEIPELENLSILTVIADSNQTIWLGTRNNGIFQLTNEGITHFSHNPNVPKGLTENGARALMFDRFHNLWIGLFGSINRVNFRQQNVPFYQITPGNHTYGNYIHRIMQDSSGGFWFRLLREGLGCSSALGSEFHVLLQPKPNAQIEEIKHFCVDSDGNVWVATLTSGLFQFKKGSQSFLHINLGDSMESAYLHSISVDNTDQQYLWFSSQYGLCRVNRFTHNRTWFHPMDDLEELDRNAIGPFCQSQDGNIWCNARINGKLKPMYFDLKKKRFAREASWADYEDSIIIKRTYTIKAVRENILWMGTTDGIVVIDAIRKNYFRLSSKDSFPTSHVKSIRPDQEGNIWFTDQHKIYKFDGTCYQSQDLRMGIESFNYLSSAIGSDGRLTFGGSNGFYSFYPEEFTFNKDTLCPSVYLTNFKVLNEDRRLNQAFEDVRNIELDYEENVFTFEYAALHFLNENQIQYQHILEPFENDWVKTNSNERLATYTNLSPGTYTFKVKAGNADGFWTKEENVLSVSLKVLPPWWKTWWANVIWIILLLSGLYSLYRFQLNRRLADAETRRLRELDSLKTRLYTNITHEFRTPLTVILGMTEKLVNNPKEWLEEGSRMITRNGRRLLHLVNQMLDLAKL